MPNGVHAPKPLLPLSATQSGNYGSKRRGRMSQMVIRLVLFATVSIVAAYGTFAVVFLRKATDATLEIAPVRGDTLHYLEEPDASQPSRTTQQQYMRHHRQAFAQKQAAGTAQDHSSTGGIHNAAQQQHASHDTLLDPAVTLYHHHDSQQAQQQGLHAGQGFAAHADPLKDLGITQKAFDDVVSELDSRSQHAAKVHTLTADAQTAQPVAGFEEARPSPAFTHKPGSTPTHQPEVEAAHQPGSNTGSVVMQRSQSSHTAASPTVSVPAHTVETDALHSSPAHAPQPVMIADGSKARGLYALTAHDVYGVEQPLSQYAGNITLVVNVASACGYTDSNYKGLQATYEKYSKFGFTVLAFPCNQFGSQEPGSEADIKAFCSQRYHVTFPLFSKVDVNGAKTHPVFKFLKQHLPAHEGGGGGTGAGQDIRWNFYKFLVDHTGQPIKRWDSNYDVAAVEHEVYDALLARNAAIGSS